MAEIIYLNGHREPHRELILVCEKCGCCTWVVYQRGHMACADCLTVPATGTADWMEEPEDWEKKEK